MKRWLAGVAVLLVVVGAGLAWRNARVLDRLDRRFTADTLTADDRRALAEARRLKAAYGQRVWPGLERADLPQVLYDDRWEFLVGWRGPRPAGWTRAGDAVLFEVPAWRREARDPRPFALEVEDRWAGRYPVRRLLDRQRIRRARRGMDPMSAALVPPDLSTVPPDLYVVQLLHTAFHAFQASRSQDRFYRAVERRRRTAGRYPFDDPEISELWTREGGALARILAAEGSAEACRAVQAFRSTRARRRGHASLDSTLVAYERDQEWLQGLAKYAEVTFYRRAAEGRGAPEGIAYEEGPAHWERDFRRLRSSLGEEGADRRFALSGLGLALALQRLSPGWKPRVLSGERLPGELLGEACGGDG